MDHLVASYYLSAPELLTGNVQLGEQLELEQLHLFMAVLQLVEPADQHFQSQLRLYLKAF